MSHLYSYSYSVDFNNYFKNFQFRREVRANGTLPELKTVAKNGDTINLYFQNELTNDHQNTLDSIVSNHTAETISDNDIVKNVSSTIAPNANDDITKDLNIGSLWIDTTNSDSYICTSGATGAAVWKNLTTGRFEAYNTASQNISNNSSWTAINLDVQRTIDTSHFTHVTGTSEVTVNVSGTYLVIARFTCDAGTNSRANIQHRIAVNGVGEPGSLVVTYNRNDIQGLNSASSTMIRSLNATDTIRMESQRLSGGANSSITVIDGCSLLLIRV